MRNAQKTANQLRAEQTKVDRDAKASISRSGLLDAQERWWKNCEHSDQTESHPAQEQSVLQQTQEIQIVDHS
jgi:hypothetical protein